MKNMKNIMVTISVLLIYVTVLAGCGSDPVQDDLINYINNQVPTIAALEEKVTSEYQAVKTDSNADDTKFGAKLNDVIIPANDKLAESEKLSKEYLANLETLKKDHGVENK